MERLSLEVRFQGAHCGRVLEGKSPVLYRFKQSPDEAEAVFSSWGEGCHLPSAKFCSDFGLSADGWFLMTVQRERNEGRHMEQKEERNKDHSESFDSMGAPHPSLVPPQGVYFGDIEVF